MYNRKLLILTLATLIAGLPQLLAEENIGSGKRSTSIPSTLKNEVADCPASESSFDLSINNVRTTLLGGGDLWWDLANARYEIPKIDPPGSAPSVHSLFAGAIWISGLDEGGNLKIAAQTYRQGGDDFWPGPIDGTGQVDQLTCQVYDNHFSVRGSEIDLAIAEFEATGAVDVTKLSSGGILEGVGKWPGKNNPLLLVDQIDVSRELAPFFDRDGDGNYDPRNGDYPVIKKNPSDGQFTFADQMVFWVYNDVGNVHTETGGEDIGIQINALAFAFQTSDAINDMSFYRYKIINQGSFTLTSAYMGQWVDADLGCFQDDLVGCDTALSLGIVYNGDNFDEDCGPRGYGAAIPLLGIDYFESPKDTGDDAEELGMSSFVYYNNDFSGQGNPTSAAQFRNYMTGFWRDGSPIEFDGDGYQESTFPFPFMFPDDPDDAAGWSECQEGNPPFDRRFLQNSGPFTLKAGADNFITIGAVWVQQPDNFQSGCFANFDLLRDADQRAQALFDNNFNIVNGPDAPTVKVRELKNAVILSLINEPTSNNFNEAYSEADPLIQIEDPTSPDSLYTFQGYKVYQLVDGQVSVQDLDDPTKSKLIFQADVEDQVSRIINYSFDQIVGAEIPSIRADGLNEGIEHTILVDQDAFASSDPRLVNHQTYYFMAIAYGHNNFTPFDPTNPSGGGQKEPYKQGRKNVKVYSAIPHIPDPRNDGTVLNSEYGDPIAVQRVEGEGNGGQAVKIVQRTEDNILGDADHRFDTLEYEPGFSPIAVKVTDPVALIEAQFELHFIDPDTIPELSDEATWVLRDLTNNRVIMSDRDISRASEQVVRYTNPMNGSITDYGFSIELGQPVPRYDYTFDFVDKKIYDFLDASIEFADETNPWLAAVPDIDGLAVDNWIRAGAACNDETPQDDAFSDNTTRPCDDAVPYDPDQAFESMAGGTFAPYSLCCNYADDITGSFQQVYTHGPAFKWDRYATNQVTQHSMENMKSVLVVITPDQTKWSRCMVFETGENHLMNEGLVRKGQMRFSPSRDFAGNITTPTPVTDIVPGEAYILVGANSAQNISYPNNTAGTTTVTVNNNTLYGGFIADDIDVSTTIVPTAEVTVYRGDDYGYSYFPGYAINLENGERLNLYFGESSTLISENGRDMMWNPSQNLRGTLGQVLHAGKHFVYVMSSKYDEGNADHDIMVEHYNEYSGGTLSVPFDLRQLYNRIMYTSIPFLNPDFEFNGMVPPDNEVKVNIQVAQPYAKYGTQVTNTDSLPRYLFSTIGMGPQEGVNEVAINALDLIRAVPNPYYAFSEYEISQLDNRIKITNLPNTCTVTVYTLDGQIIRRFRRAIDSNEVDISEGQATDAGVNSDNSIDWDLKNHVGVPISSGLYLIHVVAEGVGEATVKFFAGMRPTDLDSF